MRIAYLDTIGGISGDMTLGAFVSAGLSIDELREEIAKLNLQGVELEARHLTRNGITAVKIDVVISVKQMHRRHLKDIIEVINKSSLSSRVKDDAKKIFSEVARAEAKVHHTTIEKIHFHEVGALDSIVDIVGVAICLEKFGIEAVYSSPVRLGSGGFIDTEHGKLPLPGPAAAEILTGYPATLTGIPYELTTPTGAAIIKSLSSGVLSTEQFRIERIGYGAGSRELPDIPNLLRVIVADLPEKYDADELVIAETNIDNMNPEIYPFVIEQLLAAGANDVYMVPVIMKKGRPGMLLSTLVSRSQLEKVSEVLFAQTTTIGLRIIPTERKKLHREERTIATRFGAVRFKAITTAGVERLVPEYEECKRLALEHNIPLISIYKILEQTVPAPP